LTSSRTEAAAHDDEHYPTGLYVCPNKMSGSGCGDRHRTGLEIVLEGLAAHGAAHTWSLDEPAGHDDGGAGSGDRARFAAALGRSEPEFDLVEHREGLAPLLAMLPERERRILLLRFFGGLTQTEIAAQVGLSQMHVSRLLSRTLTRLRRQLAAG
jgi:RNA polymerase sigma-B factor